MAITMRLEACDANLLQPIMKYPEYYNKWCTSKGYTAVGPETVSLPIQFTETF